MIGSVSFATTGLFFTFTVLEPAELNTGNPNKVGSRSREAHHPRGIMPPTDMATID